jgi:glycosyltransferase involved in cell wall biosynthesis
LRIYYLVPVTERPSWGMGIIYDQVKMLTDAGFDATIIKERDLYVPSWLNLRVPIKDYPYLKRTVQPSDVLVVPEAMINFPGLKGVKCVKILFVQAGAFMFEQMPKGEDHLSLGFKHAFIIMPHMESIVRNHVKVPYTLIRPYVADYFFNEHLTEKREKRILIYPKFHQIDFSIVKYLVERHVESINKPWLKNIFTKDNWSVTELKGLTHKEMAQELKTSSFFISLNLFEALNTSVVEAMAAGCIVFCYNGFGPRDFLKNGQNAMVFENNEAYKLAEAIIEWIDSYEQKQELVFMMQRNAFETASYYKREFAEQELLAFFKSYNPNQKA